MKRKPATYKLPLLLLDKVEMMAGYMGLSKTSYVILALTERIEKDLKKLAEGSYGKEIN